MLLHESHYKARSTVGLIHLGIVAVVLIVAALVVVPPVLETVHNLQASLDQIGAGIGR